MLCKNCGQTNEDDAVHCTECGEFLIEEPKIVEETEDKPSMFSLAMLVTPIFFLVVIIGAVLTYKTVLSPRAFSPNSSSNLVALTQEHTNYTIESNGTVTFQIPYDLMANEIYQSIDHTNIEHLTYNENTNRYESNVKMGAFEFFLSHDIALDSDENNNDLVIHFSNAKTFFGDKKIFSPLNMVFQTKELIDGTITIPNISSLFHLQEINTTKNGFVLVYEPREDVFAGWLNLGKKYRETIFDEPIPVAYYQDNPYTSLVATLDIKDSFSKEDIAPLVSYVITSDYDDEEIFKLYDFFQDDMFYHVKRSVFFFNDYFRESDIMQVQKRKETLRVELSQSITPLVTNIFLPELVTLRENTTEAKNRVLITSSTVYNMETQVDMWEEVKSKILDTLSAEELLEKGDVAFRYDSDKKLMSIGVPVTSFEYLFVNEDGTSQKVDRVNLISKSTDPVSFPFPGNDDRRSIVRAIAAFEKTGIDYYVRYMAVSKNAAFAVLSPTDPEHFQTFQGYYLEKNKNWSVVQKARTFSDYQSILDSKTTKAFPLQIFPAFGLNEIPIKTMRDDHLERLTNYLVENKHLKEITPVEYASALGDMIYVKYNGPQNACFLIKNVGNGFFSLPAPVVPEVTTEIPSPTPNPTPASEAMPTEPVPAPLLLAPPEITASFQVVPVSTYEDFLNTIDSEKKIMFKFVGLQTNF